LTSSFTAFYLLAFCSKPGQTYHFGHQKIEVGFCEKLCLAVAFLECDYSQLLMAETVSALLLFRIDK
jgi:hypothetical protein